MLDQSGYVSLGHAPSYTADFAVALLVSLSTFYYLDFSPIAALCGRVHDQLGPSILSHLYQGMSVTPAFTPEVCHDFIVMSHWGGWDGAEELLELARQDLAYAGGVPGESSSDEVVEAYADSHYLTPRHVDERLEQRYQKPGGLTLGACRDLCSAEQYPNLRTVLDLLSELNDLDDALPQAASEYLETLEGDFPYALIVGLPQSQEGDLVAEIYDEYVNTVWQSGEFSPVYALALDPNDQGNLATFRGALGILKRSLELTQQLCATLEVTSCLCP